MILDISQEVFSSHIHPGNPVPEHWFVKTLAEGGSCNLSAISMCAHNGTHVDAPFHFLADGKTIDQVELEPFVGRCYVARTASTILPAEEAEAIVQRAQANQAAERILVSGRAWVSPAAAQVFADAGLKLIGVEPQAIGTPEDAKAVHRTLLGAGVSILEGTVLDDVPDGVYFLNAAPINLGGSDGAPCRAYLIPLP